MAPLAPGPYNHPLQSCSMARCTIPRPTFASSATRQLSAQPEGVRLRVVRALLLPLSRGQAYCRLWQSFLQSFWESLAVLLVVLLAVLLAVLASPLVSAWQSLAVLLAVLGSTFGSPWQSCWQAGRGSS